MGPPMIKCASYIFAATCAVLTATCLGEAREHRIHNIVLYPEKESWCKTEPIKQVVSMPGYSPVTIDNNVCVGACYSYSIPKTQPAEPGELIGPYCDSCQPVDTKCYHVTLQADSSNTGPETIQKRVQIIEKCSCMSCDKIESRDCDLGDLGTSEWPSSVHSKLNSSSSNHNDNHVPDLSELLNLPKPLNRSSSSSSSSTSGIPSSSSSSSSGMFKSASSPPKNYELNAGLVKLLKSIQSEDEDDEDEDESSNFTYDREQLKELLEIIEGASHELSDKNLMDFVNFVNVHNSEDLELDLSKLKEVLTSFRKGQEVLEEHRNFGLGPKLEDPLKIDLLGKAASNNQDIERDIENLSQKYNVPKTFGLEGSHLGMPSHYKGSHIGMGIKHNTNNNHNNHNNNNNNNNNLITSTDLNSKPSHHVGEEVHVHGETGHLQKGPHGSLAFVPDAKLKLNLDTNQVKPYHEGAVFSYENEPKKK